MKNAERYESRVRSYCRSFPVVFSKGMGSQLWDEDGRVYLDFFAGAGALNYGHNPPDIKEALLNYLSADGVVHSLDMSTIAKEQFLGKFHDQILQPRKLDYLVQFPGPTGTNAVEAALKLARKYTGRTSVLSFTNAFHGMTLGSLAVTGNQAKRDSAGLPLSGASSMPFDGFLGQDVDSLGVLESYLDDSSSGVATPAGIIVETVQAEGGINVASPEWLKRLQALCRRHGIVFIVDDIQVGCGRTGPFFSFERAGLEPDIVCLSKSISGYGLPMALVLLKPELDVWNPGEHNGTFRGHNPAFVTATAALGRWTSEETTKETQRKAAVTEGRLRSLLRDHGDQIRSQRGVGLIQGIEFAVPEMASDVSRRCFEKGLIIETSGSDDQVLKLLPALTIEDAQLNQGLDIIERCVADSIEEHTAGTRAQELRATGGVRA